ncbi:MAG: RDD family protein [SAR324 cluster bacterium]|nr:RDD family protein [SAR324 cluster bacterium]MCH8885362.1 RDD family protein [SAR324 cluster bacterium]
MTAQPSTPPASPASLAPHHQRLFALILDYLLVVMTLNVAQKILLGMDMELNAPSMPWWALLAPGAVLIAFKDTLGGVSPGRWITGIAVVSAADPGSAPSWRRLALRNLFLILLPLEAAMVFFDPFYRRLGDRVAGTVVVTPNRVAPYTRRLLGLAILFLATFLIILGLESWRAEKVRQSAAYRTALEAAAVHPKVIAAVGEAPRFGDSLGGSLMKDPQGVKAVVILRAEGKQGEFEVKVVLRRNRGAGRWRVEEVTVSKNMDR